MFHKLYVKNKTGKIWKFYLSTNNITNLNLNFIYLLTGKEGSLWYTEKKQCHNVCVCVCFFSKRALTLYIHIHIHIYKTIMFV